MEGALGFPGLSRYGEELDYAGSAETSGIGPLRNRSCAFVKILLVAKIFENTRGCKCAHPPPAVRWLNDDMESRSRRSIISQVELSRWRGQNSSRSIESIDDLSRSIDDGDSIDFGV